jgi:(p)ppGpp synthase/HD superfamily hydrolase
MPTQPKHSVAARARDFCRRAHREQMRDDGTPYATHPEATAEILRSHGIEDEVVLAAAYLHDVLEDTGTGEEQLLAEFGESITNIVKELTRSPNERRAEKQATLLRRAATMSANAKLVKLADRLHNLRDMTGWEEWRRRRYARESMELLDALRPWPSDALAAAVRDAAAAYLARHSPR